MSEFNRTHQLLRSPDRAITLGLMLPLGPELGRGEMVDPQVSIELARQAEAAGFTGVWVRDVPLAVPQGLTAADKQATFLDDPFLTLGSIAAATTDIALGTAAIVLPLRHHLHVANSALTLDRLSSGRFILGLGSGDRPEEFEIFGRDLDRRREDIRAAWPVLRSALSPAGPQREALLRATGGHAPTTAPPARIPMIVVGSARQTVQWIARNADGWATYYRPAQQQVSRLDLWDRARGSSRPLLISSMSLDLRPGDSASETELGVRADAATLVDTLHRLAGMGIDHVILNLRGPDPAAVITQLGAEVLPHL